MDLYVWRQRILIVCLTLQIFFPTSMWGPPDGLLYLWSYKQCVMTGADRLGLVFVGPLPMVLFGPLIWMGFFDFFFLYFSFLFLSLEETSRTLAPCPFGLIQRLGLTWFGGSSFLGTTIRPNDSFSMFFFFFSNHCGTQQPDLLVKQAMVFFFPTSGAHGCYSGSQILRPTHGIGSA